MSGRAFFFPAGIYVSTTALVVWGIASALGWWASWDDGGSWIAAIERFDAKHYVSIAKEGYHYTPEARSSVAFFPAYPLAVRAAANLSLGSISVTAVVLSNIFLCSALVVFYRYLLGREHPPSVPDSARPLPVTPLPRETSMPAVAGQRYATPELALLSLSVFPPTFFFRAAYSEALFLLVTAVALLAMQQHWRLAVTAFWIGLATATRPVGIALVPCFMLYLWAQFPLVRRRDRGGKEVLWENWPRWLSVPLAAWGLIAYMIYQAIAFGEPLAFAKTQAHWTLIPIGSRTDRFLSLASLEPIWSTYLPSSPYYWNPTGAAVPVLGDLGFANPIYLVGGVGLVLLGAWKRWLSGGEVLLAAGMIAIAYTTRGYEWGTLSQGRFMAAVLPVFIVLGHLGGRLPKAAVAAALVISGGLMALYAAQFAAGKTLL